ncbi:MAG: LysR family transcriptional regulator [Roseimicrobium sp.]
MTADFLNYHHLRYFWAVAREGSIRAAAEKLSISQPSICAQIQLLEEALGGDLFRQTGRTLALTEFGQLILGYAEEIFALGSEILSAANQAPTLRSLRLKAGIVDSFPKLMSYDILRPIFEHEPPVQLTCQEGKLPDLLALLTVHRLDVVLADEPASPGHASTVFNHLLGTCGITFCAMPSLAKTFKGRFPRNLHSAPALLPTPNCSLRRDLENWFRQAGIQPRVIAEFEDAALAKIVATRSAGFIAVPTLVEAEAVERYGFNVIGRTKDITTQFFAITAERRLTHPAIMALTTARSTAKKKTRG